MKEEIQYEITYSKIKNVYIQIKEGKIIIKAPKRISKKELEKIIENKSEWIKSSLEKSKQKQEKSEKYTKEIVEKQANELIKETGLVPNKIRIKDIKYAWGTCSANKNITINYKLIKYSEQAIKYVILHELCHLKYMNHSKEFWGLVERYMQNYKEIKREFKE